jgi:hypothetical protein
LTTLFAGVGGTLDLKWAARALCKLEAAFEVSANTMVGGLSSFMTELAGVRGTENKLSSLSARITELAGVRGTENMLALASSSCGRITELAGVRGTENTLPEITLSPLLGRMTEFAGVRGTKDVSSSLLVRASWFVDGKEGKLPELLKKSPKSASAGKDERCEP